MESSPPPLTHTSPSPYSAPSTDPSAIYQAEVSALCLDHLRRTKIWVTIISILGIIILVLMLLAAIALITTTMAVDTSEPLFKSSKIVYGICYLAVFLLFAFPVIKLAQYSRSIAFLLSSQTIISLEMTLNHQRVFWKYCGIATLAMIALYILAIFNALR